MLGFQPLQLNENVSYEEKLKVLWQNHQVEEATGEHEDEMRAKYPKLFMN